MPDRTIQTSSTGAHLVQVKQNARERSASVHQRYLLRMLSAREFASEINSNRKIIGMAAIIRVTTAGRWGAVALATAIVAVGSMYAGMAKGEADTHAVTPSEETVAESVQSRATIEVAVHNGTAQPLIGEWHAQYGSNTATIDLRTAALPSGQGRAADIEPDTFHELYTWGRVCFKHSWWNLVRHSYAVDESAVYLFRLQSNENETRLTAVGQSHTGQATFPMVETEHGTAC